ncbi:hypothetical protein THAOC_14443, partial [Thalassiosira oceanica]
MRCPLSNIFFDLAFVRSLAATVAYQAASIHRGLEWGVDTGMQVSNVPEFKEAKENFGARWPKVSLAALRDDAPDISMKDLKELTDACREFDAQLQNLVLRLRRATAKFGAQTYRDGAAAGLHCEGEPTWEQMSTLQLEYLDGVDT